MGTPSLSRAAPSCFAQVQFALLALAGAALAVPGTASAQSDGGQSGSITHSMAVTGNTPEICALQPGATQVGSLVNISGLDGDTLTVIQFVDPQTLAIRAANATISIAAVCNFPHRLRIESENNGMWPGDGRQSLDKNGFTSAVPYTARVNWSGTTNTLTTDGRVRQLVDQRVNISAAAAGNLELRVEIAPGASNTRVNAPVLAGTYSDTLRIYLEPR